MIRSRYRVVSSLFARILISLAFWELLLPRLGLRKWSQQTRSRRLKKIGVYFRTRAVELGGVLIKVGQFLSSRVDVMPHEITEELEGLQDEVPPESIEDIRKVAESELGTRLDEAFEWFNTEPMAAASLGQVHKARIRAEQVWEGASVGPSSFEVVVKVQRPEIERIIETDMAALRRAGRWISLYRPVSKRANIPSLIDEFNRVLHEEIDYEAEGRNAETFAANFKQNPGVRVPHVVWKQSTRRVLTLEDVQAIKITNYDEIIAAGIDRTEVAKRLLDTYMQQMVIDCFFHADPHPGNLFVAPLDPPVVLDPQTGSTLTWQLTFVDFGMVGHLSANMRDGIRELLIGLGTRDAARTTKAYKLMGILLPSANVDLLEQAESEVFDRFWGKSMDELKQVGFQEAHDFAIRFRDLLYDLPFQVPEDLILIGRTVGILSGMCTGLDPAFNVWNEMIPYARKFIEEDATGNRVSWLSEIGVYLQRLLTLPQRTESVLERLERGEMEVRDRGLSMQVGRVERSVRRAGGAVLAGALVLAGVQMFLAGYPVPAWILWAAAAVTGLWSLL